MPNARTHWQKPTPETIALFNQLIPDDAGIERRKMFGFPCAFLQGNMFAWIHQNHIALRLPEPLRKTLIAQQQAQPVDPSGKRMREYVMLDETLACRQAEADALVNKSLEYVASLPPKK